MLNDRGYNTEKLSVNHDTIKILEKNNKLEFILDKNDSDEICCIKYMMQKIRPTYRNPFRSSHVTYKNLRNTHYTDLHVT